MSGQSDDTDKSYEPTPQKLQKAREKGEIARSTDLSVAAAYAGLLLAALAVGAGSMLDLGTVLMVLIDQAESLAPLVFEGSPSAPLGGLMWRIGVAMAPWFIIPAAAVILSILAQRGFVMAPSKLAFKTSRISILSNARNKFGRSGLFEFAKSFSKLCLYSVCLAVFLKVRLPDIVAAAGTEPQIAIAQMFRLCVEFLFLALLIAGGIGAVDTIWQHQEHLRKNRMSRKEITDETKDAEGDPHMKQQRRQRAQEIAMSQMMADVPNADVIVVNPTHYAVALQWSRLPGTAPVCVAKGVDAVAATIRKIGHEAGVPVHSDPPTARAIYASVELGQEVAEDHYQAVAAAIRFAEDMRRRAKGQLG